MPLPIEPVKDFRKAVEYVAGRGHHRNEIFRDFVSLALYSIVKHSILVANASGAQIKSDPEAWEQNYMTVMRRYTEHAGKEDASADGQLEF